MLNNIRQYIFTGMTVFFGMLQVCAATRQINITLRNHLTTSMASVSVLLTPKDAADVPQFIEPVLRVVAPKVIAAPSETQGTIPISPHKLFIASFSLFYWGANRDACGAFARFEELEGNPISGLEIDVQLSADGKAVMDIQPVPA